MTAGRGRQFLFHGSFSEKADARKKEKRRPGSFIKRIRTRCAGSGKAGSRKSCTRYLVLTQK